jgi:hypothetical protein
MFVVGIFRFQKWFNVDVFKFHFHVGIFALFGYLKILGHFFQIFWSPWIDPHPFKESSQSADIDNKAATVELDPR